VIPTSRRCSAFLMPIWMRRVSDLFEHAAAILTIAL
jgi:hypothetical protein